MGTATWRGGVSGWCPAIVVIAPPQKEEDRDCMDDSNNNGDVDDVYDDIKRLRQQLNCREGCCFSQNFAMKYIYYWMELDANDINGASLLPPSSSSS